MVNSAEAMINASGAGEQRAACRSAEQWSAFLEVVRR